jgi:polysaccharide biosynthesis protein PslH
MNNIDISKINILILANYFIIPPISGGAMRMINPYIALGKTGRYEVTYLIQYWINESLEQKRRFFASYPWIHLEGACRDGQLSLKERTSKLEIPLDVFNTFDWEYFQELKRLLETRHFDLIQIEHSQMSWAVPFIRTKAPNIPIILDMHNVEATTFERWIPFLKGTEREDMILRFQKMRQWEFDTWRWFDACLAVSPIEKDVFDENTGHNIPSWELPTGGGIDLERFSWPPPQKGKEKGAILHIGTMAWGGSTNEHGLLWFIDTVMPLVKERCPEAHLYLAGFGTPNSEFIKHIQGRKDIIYLGEVKDEIPYFNRCQVSIVPIWVGGGARVKIPTAWGAGIPLVSTSLGAEGLAYTDGQEILIADKPTDFAKKIIKIIQNENIGKALSVAGRELVEKRYSLDFAVKRYDEIYASLVNSKSDYKLDSVEYEREKSIRHLLELKTDIEVFTGIRSSGPLKQSFSENNERNQNYRSPVLLDKLMPLGTKRRGAFELVRAGIRIIRKNGFRIFYKRMSFWLHKRFKRTEEYHPSVDIHKN